MAMMHHQVEALLHEKGYTFASAPRATEVEGSAAIPHRLTFSCIRQRDGTRVTLKVLLHNNNEMMPTPLSLPRSLSNFQHEHRIVEQLREVDGVVKIHERFSVANVVEALVMEDFGGECLDEWLRREGPFVERLAEFMELAIEVTKTLSQIHAHNIVHKNIQVCPRSTHTLHIIKCVLIMACCCCVVLWQLNSLTAWCGTRAGRWPR